MTYIGQMAGSVNSQRLQLTECQQSWPQALLLRTPHRFFPSSSQSHS